MSSLKTNKIRIFLYKWHKKLGILSAFFVVFLSVTGIFLNHSHSLKLDQLGVSQQWLLNAYGVKPQPLTSFHVGDVWLSQLGRDIFFNSKLVNRCDSNIVGAVKAEHYYAVACQTEVVLVSFEGELIETVGQQYHLPLPILAIGQCEENVLCIQAPKQDGADVNVFKVDFDNLQWQQMDSFPKSPNWSYLSSHIPAELSNELSSQSHGGQITYERLLLDVHAGRFFGPLGPIFMDLVALVFIILAGSGSYLWWKKSRILKSH